VVPRMSRRVSPLLADGVLLLVLLYLAALYTNSPEPSLCDKGWTISKGMTHDQVVAVLGPSPYPRGEWPDVGRIWLGYPERCERWEDGPNSVIVRFDPETHLVDYKEIVYVAPKPSPARQLLECMHLLEPRLGRHYAGP